MSIDLRIERPGGTWVRRFGLHEEAEIVVALNDASAHVTLTKLKLDFYVDRQDCPAAWDKHFDVGKVRGELLAAIVRRMSVEVLEALFREIYSQVQSARWEGEHEAKNKIRTALREALGL